MKLQTSIYGIQLGDMFLTFDKYNVMWSGKGNAWKFWPPELTFNYSIQTFRMRDSLMWSGKGYVFVRKDESGHDINSLCKALDQLVKTLMPVFFKGRRSILIYGQQNSKCFLVQNGEIFTKTCLSSYDIFRLVDNHAIITTDDNGNNKGTC